MIARVTSVEQLEASGALVLGEKFFAEAGLPGRFIPEVFTRNWKKFLELQCGAMWLSLNKRNEVAGAIGGLIHPDPCDDALVAQELFWFMDPTQRTGTSALRLLKEFEDWAMMRGAKRICMANVCNKYMVKLRKMYERRGYRAVDVSYFKEVPWS